jgi:hypothetical protein
VARSVDETNTSVICLCAVHNLRGKSPPTCFTLLRRRFWVWYSSIALSLYERIVSLRENRPSRWLYVKRILCYFLLWSRIYFHHLLRRQPPECSSHILSDCRVEVLLHHSRSKREWSAVRYWRALDTGGLILSSSCSFISFFSVVLLHRSLLWLSAVVLYALAVVKRRVERSGMGRR